jgi:MFS family permease
MMKGAADGLAGAGASWRRWGCLLASGGLFLVVNIHRYAVGTLAGVLMTAFGATAVEMGGLASLYFYLYGFLQVPSGILADTWGPRHTLLLSGTCLAAGAALCAWAPGLPGLYAGRTLVGLGAAAVFVNGLRLFATWFDPWHFATLVGLLNFLGYTGAFLAGAPLAAAADALGWRHVFWALAAATTLIALACWILVRDHPPGGDAASETPTLRAALQATLVVLRNREVWKALLTKLGLDSSNFVFFALWAVPYLSQVYALPRAIASRYVSTANVAFALGAPCMGLLSDRVFQNRRSPILLAGTGYLLLWGIVLFPPAGPHGPLLFGAVSFAMGFLASSLLLTLSVARDLSAPVTAGVATATVNAGGFLGAAAAQLVTSAILDLLWAGGMAGGGRVYPLAAFRTAFLVCVGLVALSLVAAWRIREARPP